MIERDAQRVNTFTTAQWECLITNALTKKNGKRRVKMSIISFNDILDFNQFSGLVNPSGSSIKWSKLKQVKFSADGPTKMLFKYRYAEVEYQEVDFVQCARKSKRISSSSQTLPSMTDLPKCYLSPPGITAEKYDSSQKLCYKNLVPPHHHKFYKDITKSGPEDDSN